MMLFYPFLVVYLLLSWIIEWSFMLTGLLLLLKKYVLSSTFYDISLNTVTLSKLCHKNNNYLPLFFLDGVLHDADK